MLKKIKANDGFTLVELTVSLALVVTIIALSCTVLVTVLGHYGSDSRVTQAKVIGDTTSNWLDKQLRYATKLEITDDAKTATYNTAIQVQDGNLMYWKTDKPNSLKNLYTKEYYNGMTVKTVSSVKDDRWLTITIYVYDNKDKQLYAKERTYEIINMGLVAETKGENPGSSEPPPTGDPDTSGFKISGNLATEVASENAVFCFFSDLVAGRGDYLAQPSTMYDFARKAYVLLSGEGEEKEKLREEYNNPGQNTKYLYNEGIRNYVRRENYGGNWPDISAFMDIKPISEDLAKLKINIQLHYNIKNNNIVIYGRSYGDADPNANTWYEQVLYFVPNTYSESNVDMSSGKWYTNRLSNGHPKNTKKPEGNESTLEALNRDIVKFYDEVKRCWHPLDGEGCTCEEFHKHNKN